MNLVTFTEEILNGKLNFLCSASNRSIIGSILDQNDNNIVKTLLYGLDSRRLILDAVKKQDVRRLFQYGLVRLGTPLF